MDRGLERNYAFLQELVTSLANKHHLVAHTLLSPSKADHLLLEGTQGLDLTGHRESANTLLD